jgi:error-prone DNA polymerase
MDDRTFIEWDKDDIDELGILKIDVLALGMLTCIRKCFDLIERHHGERWELATVPQEEPGVYEMLCRGRLAGACSRSRAAPDEHASAPAPTLLLRSRHRGRDRAAGPIQGDMVHPISSGGRARKR